MTTDAICSRKACPSIIKETLFMKGQDEYESTIGKL